MQININKSINFSKKSRNKQNIKFLIIHYTGMQSARVSLNKLKNPKTKVSCHYFIDRKGVISRIVDDNKVAWHAGKSRWKNFRNLNKNSIGIEIQNKGHSIGYEKFSKKQINSLIKLMKILKKKYNIKKQNIMGHSDIAPLRKLDPGEKFPWKLLSKYELSIWYKVNKMQKFNFNFKNKRNLFFKNIYKLGYRYFKLAKKSETDKRVIKAFQMRFLPKEVSGKITDKTLKISYLLSN